MLLVFSPSKRRSDPVLTVENLLEVNNLKKYFPVSSGMLSRSKKYVYAVDNVNLVVRPGETLGIVGESGCGKTTLARCIMALEKPTAGEVRFRGINIFDLKGRDLKKIRSKMQVVFQDPYASLNPRWSIRDIVSEPMVVSGLVKRGEVRDRVIRLLELVGLNGDHVYRFPHEFSGGQRQRIGIARALSVNPELVVLDEPTSSLDVSVQAQILNLLKKLQEELNLTYIFISHNLSVVKHMATRIAVMYLGKIVELGSTEGIFDKPLHPYTRGLLESVPIPDVRAKRQRAGVLGDIPDPSNPPTGCNFNPRCPIAINKCKYEYPALLEYSQNHFAACHLASSSDEHSPSNLQIVSSTPETRV
jgi:oligopeptide/dipeptide ABC transporter ATP-binding protein